MSKQQTAVTRTSFNRQDQQDNAVAWLMGRVFVGPHPRLNASVDTEKKRAEFREAQKSKK